MTNVGDQVKGLVSPAKSPFIQSQALNQKVLTLVHQGASLMSSIWPIKSFGKPTKKNHGFILHV